MGYLDESWQSKTIRNTKGGNSLAVQWLGLCVFTAEGPGSIPGRGSKIPKAARQEKQNNNNKKHKRTKTKQQQQKAQKNKNKHKTTTTKKAKKKKKKTGKEKKPTVGRALIASSPSEEVWSLLDAW